MTVLMNGYPKSGNYLLWNVLRELLAPPPPHTHTLGGHSQGSIIKSYCKDVLAKAVEVSLFDKHELIDRVTLDVERKTLLLGSGRADLPVDTAAFMHYAEIIWTHDCFSTFHRSFYDAYSDDLEIRRFYLCRDPRSVYLSLAHHLTRPEYFKIFPSAWIKTPDGIFSKDEFAVKWMKQWKNHVLGFLENADWFSLVRYEDLILKKEQTVNRLSDLLLNGHSSKNSAVNRALNQTDFTAMKKKSPNHVRSETVDEWKTTVPTETLAIIQEIVGPEMKELGYHV